MKKTLITLAVASSLYSAVSHAEIQLSGFASIVGGITSSSDETLYGYDDHFNFSQGSFFALQATSDLSDKLGATVQIVARGEDDWDPEFNWAFLSYDATDDLRILAGRQRIPFYMYSDFLDVSYAFPWITPIENAYGAPFNTYDGLGAIYNTSVGDADVTFHGIFGQNTSDVPAGSSTAEAVITGMSGLAVTYNYDWLTLRAAYFRFDELNINAFDGFADMWNAASQASGEDYSDIAASMQVLEDSVSFATLAFQMNFERFSLVGEYTKLTLDNTPLSNGEAYYVMAGYQVLDNVLVHLTYDYEEQTIKNYTSNVSFGPFPEVNMAKGATEGFSAGQAGEESGITLGVRYDFHDSAALKFEYKDYSDKLNSDNDAGLFRVALVTVF